jgi:hypothetical protein
MRLAFAMQPFSKSFQRTTYKRTKRVLRIHGQRRKGFAPGCQCRPVARESRPGSGLHIFCVKSDCDRFKLNDT